MNMMRTCFTVILAVFLFACVEPPATAPEVTVARRAPESPPGVPRVVLIFEGDSAWTPEVDTLKGILVEHGVGFSGVSSAGMNAMSLDEMAAYGVMIFPGGSAPAMASSLAVETKRRLREAIQERGMSYLGFCAGAWLAISPLSAEENDVKYGIGVVDGPVQELTEMAKKGVAHTIEKAIFPDGSRRDLLWYGGPITPDLSGGVVAKYQNGSPAITQMKSGRGFVIVSGLHPATPGYVVDSLGLYDGDGLDYAFAWELLDAVLKQKELPAF